jgi:hypothetical protein
VWDAAGEDYTTRSFKTLAGATSAGIRALERVHKRQFYGYLRADRFEGEFPARHHIVAEWKDHSRILGRVWT